MSEPQEVNVILSESEEARFRAEDAFWDGPKLTALLVGFLGGCLVILYMLSNLACSLDTPPF